MRERGHEYIVLDGMRGIAAIAVLSYHFNPEFGLGRWFPGGQLSVDLFFVLSGFVLTHAYEQKFRAGLSPRQFMVDRLIRLYPLYLLALSLPITGLLIAGALRHQAGPALHQAIAELPWNAAFFPSPGHPRDALFPLNTPAWSLFFELVANLFFGLMRWRASDRALWCIVASGVVALVLVEVFHGDLGGGVDWATIGAGAARVLFSFPAGVLLYRLTNGSRPRSLSPWLPMIGLAILLLAPAPHGWAYGPYKLLSITIASPVLVWLGSQTRASGLTGGLCAFAGAVSYAAYVLHEPLLGVADPIALRLTGHGVYQTGAAACLAATVAVIAAAWVAHRAYDEPVRGWLRAQVRARRARVAVI